MDEEYRGYTFEDFIKKIEVKGARERFLLLDSRLLAEITGFRDRVKLEDCRMYKGNLFDRHEEDDQDKKD